MHCPAVPIKVTSECILHMSCILYETFIHLNILLIFKQTFAYYGCDPLVLRTGQKKKKKKMWNKVGEKAKIWQHQQN